MLRRWGEERGEKRTVKSALDTDSEPSRTPGPEQPLSSESPLDGTSTSERTPPSDPGGGGRRGGNQAKSRVTTSDLVGSSLGPTPTLGVIAVPAVDLGHSLGPQFPLTSEVQGICLPWPESVGAGAEARRRLPVAAHVRSAEGRALKGTCASKLGH